jgi:hypothetical protein
LKTNTELWIDADLGNRMSIEPVEWRPWHHKASPEPHRAEIQLNDRHAKAHAHKFKRQAQAPSIIARILRWFKIAE